MKHHTVLRLLSPDNSATKPTPHESLSNDGSYNPSGFSGTPDNADRTTTRSFGSLPGPSDCQKCNLSDPADPRTLLPKNDFLSTTTDFLVEAHRFALALRRETDAAVATLSEGEREDDLLSEENGAFTDFG